MAQFIVTGAFGGPGQEAEVSDAVKAAYTRMTTVASIRFTCQDEPDVDMVRRRLYEGATVAPGPSQFAYLLKLSALDST